MEKITNKYFVPLHQHSSFSTFDGLNSIETIVLYLREQGFPAAALTDHGTVGGIIKFIQLCNATKDKKGKEIPFPKIKAIPGIELYMSKNRHNKDISLQPDMKKGNYHIILHAKNFKGYQNLCQLSELSYTEGFYMNPRVDFELLSKYSEGIMCSTACLKGLVQQNLLYDRYNEAKKVVNVFKDIYKDDFSLEIMYHGIEAEKQIIGDIFRLSKETNTMIIASCDSHYLKKEQAKTQEMLMCMSTNKCIKDPKHIHFPYDEFYLKSAAEMYEIFGDAPEVLSNTLLVAEKVDINDIMKNIFISSMRLPKFEIPPQFKSQYDYLEHLAWEGMRKLGIDKSQKHIDEIKMELEDVNVALENNGYDFPSYFLIEWDIINWARKNNIFTGPGRGSGFASLLLRCLGVTYGVDPVQKGLLWERFLGFQNLRYISEKDFGIGTEISIPEPIIEIEESEEEEVIEEDFSGSGRY